MRVGTLLPRIRVVQVVTAGLVLLHQLGMSAVPTGALARELQPGDDGRAFAVAAQAGCSPRPPVKVDVTLTSPGRLQVTVTAGAGALTELRIGASNNALIDIGNQTGLGRNSTISLPPGTTSTTFTVRRASDRGDGTAPLIVKDDCGDWPTLVGGGPDAWAPPSTAPLPADPSTIVPPVPAGPAPSLASGVNFLFSGNNPIQTGVASGVISVARVAVLRGKVLDHDKQRLAGVTVTVLGHPEYGQTVSRADGQYDLAVNGGSLLILAYERDGFLPAQRQQVVPWQDYVVVEDLSLVRVDNKATRIDQASSEPVQVAEGSVSNDANGARKATLLFPQNTTAQMKLKDGQVHALATSMTVRATEFTVGPNGQAQMPAPLPPTSAYTYAVDFSVDEARMAGALDVSFNQPIPTYVENFLNIPVGTPVPVGYLDKATGLWVPVPDGRIIRLLSVNGGLAVLDVDGTGQPASVAALTQLGITDPERTKLATLYQPGQTFTRFSVTHFSTYDTNYGTVASDGAVAPSVASPGSSPEDDCDCQPGSIVEVQNQILREQIDLVGVPFGLYYNSNRQVGSGGVTSLDIPLTGATLPPGLKGVRLQITVAGKTDIRSFGAEANKHYLFVWDGKDSYGRPVAGSQTARIRVGYAYQGFYALPPNMNASFGAASGVKIPGDIPSREDVVLWQEITARLGVSDARSQGLAGWTIGVHHAYDSLGHVLYLGNGGRRSGASAVAPSIVSIAGTGKSGFGGDGGPATVAQFSAIESVAVGPDGSVYVADLDNHRVRRIDTSGIVTTVAGTGTAGFSGDGGPATQAQLDSANGIAIGPDGSLYISDAAESVSPADRVRRVTPDGIITTVAGGGRPRDGLGDGLPATQASLGHLRIITIGPDGSLFIADSGNARIRRVGPDGIISTVAGGGRPTDRLGDGGPATQAELSDASGLAIGPNGEIYISDSVAQRIRRVGPDGIITTFAGTGQIGFAGDGGSAVSARLAEPYELSLARDGSLYFADAANRRIRRITPDGIIATVVGGADAPDNLGDGGLATQAELAFPHSVAALSDGTLYVADTLNYRVRRVATSLPGFADGEIAVASDDGKFLYRFDKDGRHLSTLHALTGAVLRQFAYDAAGRLQKITDANGNVTTIEHAADGTPSAIVGPYGQRTTLAVDGSGYLSSVTNPASEAVKLGYGHGGLLASLTDPRGNVHSYTFNAKDQLTKDADPDSVGSFQTLARSDTPTGFEVARTTALNHTTTYRVERTATGDQQRTTIAPDGTATRRLAGTTGTETTTAADGTVATFIVAPDPRFGMQSPVQKELDVKTPSSKRLVTTLDRTVTLADATNPLSLTSLVETTKINNNRTFTSTYTGATRTFIDKSAVNRLLTTTLDAQGRVTSETLGGLDPLNYTYDARGRLTTIVQGNGATARTTTYAYNPEGYLATITDALGRIFSFAYDGVGRVTSRTMPDGGVVGYSYDAGGNLTTVTPAGRTAHTIAYNAVDTLAASTAPGLGAGSNSTTTFTYNADRQLAQVDRPDGNTFKVGYDPAGRLGSLTFSRGTTTYGYNPTTGQLATITAPGGISLSYAYDGQLPTGETLAGPVGGAITRDYDNDFRVTTLTVAGTAISYRYDADDLLTQVASLVLTRDPQNGLITATTLDGTNDTRTFNGFGELAAYRATAAGTARFATSYLRDAIGRITQIVEAIGAVSVTYEYAYDPDGRLTQVKQNGTATYTYAYDANGNRTSATGPGGPVTATYDVQDRLTQYGTTTYAYTANGDLQSRSVAGQTTSYVYDELGNLRSVSLPSGTQIGYLVDGRNRRVGKTVNGSLVQGFLYQDGLHPVAELDNTGKLVSLFIYGSRENVPDYLVKGGVRYRIISDHLGSPRLVINASSGALAQRLDYDAFGNVLLDTSPGFQPFGFAGGLYDRDTKLVRFGARDYDPEVGRWTARDPLHFIGRDANLYAYVENDPLNWSDPAGLMKLPGNPNGLPPSWTPDPRHRDPNGQRFRNPNGDILDFHKGRPGKNGWKGKDHWHYNEGEDHLVEGDEIPCPEEGEEEEDTSEQDSKTEDLKRRISEFTGLTGTALILYIIISEGSRIAFPPRNLIPVP